MLLFIQNYWQAVRRWPWYAALLALALLVLAGSNLRGIRLLGGDEGSGPGAAPASSRLR